MNVEIKPELKTEMIETRKIAVSTITELKKQHGNSGQRLNDAIDHNELIKNMYSIGKTVPVRIENIVVNYKILSQMLKKLRNHNYTVRVEEQDLIIDYENRSSRGKMTLVDTSRYFKHFKNVPALSLSDLQK